jgi:predicted metal-dependent phosphoesterase TrpH
MTHEFRADLHCHSICSDGSDHPLVLLEKAKQAGLQGLAITDHDTIDAYTPELFALARTLGIEILTGIELSSEFREITVHILGYGFDLKSSSLLAFIDEMQARRLERNRSILKKLEQRKMLISEEELYANAKQSVGRPHIAAIMVQKGFCSSFKIAFDQYLKEGASCYVPGFKFTPKDAIDAIHKASGKAILAHPHFIKNKSYLRALLAMPFDGIECYYGNLFPTQEKPWIHLALEKKWIATGGSDYHGLCKPNISLGCSWSSLQTFQQLKGTIL